TDHGGAKHNMRLQYRCTGSFRLVAGMLHLHNNYSFTESLVETVIRSLRHSCRSELHGTPQFPVAQTIRSPDRSELRISLPEYFRFPDGFMATASRTISSRPPGSR